MRKYHLLFVITCLTLAACNFPYQADIQQGNVFDTYSVEQLKMGMTTEQVRYILGDPVLINTFRDHTLEYVYIFKPGHRRMHIKRLLLHFSGNRLVDIDQS